MRTNVGLVQLLEVIDADILEMPFKTYISSSVCTSQNLGIIESLLMVTELTVPHC